MDIVSLYMMNDNDNQENDYHISMTNSNNTFHKNYPNEYNSNVHYRESNDHDHMDSMYDAFVLITNCCDDLVISVDDYVDDEMTKNENDVRMNNDLLSNDWYLSTKKTRFT